MKLVPKEIEAILPPLYPQEHVPDPVAVTKFFDPVADSLSTFWKASASRMATCCSRGRASALAMMRRDFSQLPARCPFPRSKPTQ
jgi:hypothetical protein